MKSKRANIYLLIYIYILMGKLGKKQEKINPDTVPDHLFPHPHMGYAQFLLPAVAGSGRSCACPKYGNATQGPARQRESIS